MADIMNATIAKQIAMDRWFGEDAVSAISVEPLDASDPTQGSAVVIFVKEGRSDELSQQLLPYIEVNYLGRSERVPVRIIEAGPFIANGVVEVFPAFAGHPEYARKVRPAKTGYSIGLGGSGSISMCIFLQGAAPEKKYFLSNAHVISNNVFRENPVIYQPGTADPGPESFGRLDSACPLSASRPNRMDAAIGVPNAPSFIVDLWDNRTMELGQPPFIGRLEKCGRTTGRVQGGRVHQQADVKVDYRGWAGLGEIHFTDQLIIDAAGNQPVSLPGDSGSMWVVNAERVFAYAINFAGPANGMYSISFPWNRVYEFWPPAQS